MYRVIIHSLAFLGQLRLLVAGVIDFLQRRKITLSALTIGHINYLVSHACFTGACPPRDVNLSWVFALTYCQ